MDEKAPDFIALSPEEHDTQAKAFFSHDTWAVGFLGARIVSAQAGASVVEMDINPKRHLNSVGNIQGGVLYSIGDYATAVADWRKGQNNTTIDSSMQFLEVAKGTSLRIEAKVQRSTRRIGYYSVEITDNLGTRVAVGHFTLFHF